MKIPPVEGSQRAQLMDSTVAQLPEVRLRSLSQYDGKFSMADGPAHLFMCDHM